jgi:hypothetical protein
MTASVPASTTARRRQHWPAVIALSVLSIGVFVSPPWQAPAEVVAARALPSSAGEARPISWELLETLDLRTGRGSAVLDSLVRQRVSLPGFLVPLDDDAQQAKEFLLVPYFGACIHLPPPPPNQMIYVTMVGDAIDFSMWEPMIIEGELLISPVDSPYGKVSYVMTGRRVRPYPYPSPGK